MFAAPAVIKAAHADRLMKIAVPPEKEIYTGDGLIGLDFEQVESRAFAFEYDAKGKTINEVYEEIKHVSRSGTSDLRDAGWRMNWDTKEIEYNGPEDAEGVTMRELYDFCKNEWGEVKPSNEIFAVSGPMDLGYRFEGYKIGQGKSINNLSDEDKTILINGGWEA